MKPPWIADLVPDTEPLVRVMEEAERIVDTLKAFSAN